MTNPEARMEDTIVDAKSAKPGAKGSGRCGKGSFSFVRGKGGGKPDKSAGGSKEAPSKDGPPVIGSKRKFHYKRTSEPRTSTDKPETPS